MTLKLFALQTPSYAVAAIPLSLSDDYGLQELIPQYRRLYENSYVFIDQDEQLLIAHTFQTAKYCRIKVVDFLNSRIIYDKTIQSLNSAFFLELNFQEYDLESSQKLRFELQVYDDSMALANEQLNLRVQSSFKLQTEPFDNFVEISLKQEIDRPILYEVRKSLQEFPDLEAYAEHSGEVVNRAFRRIERPAIAVIEPVTSFEQKIKKEKIEFEGREKTVIFKAWLNSLIEIPLPNARNIIIDENVEQAGLQYIDFYDQRLILLTVQKGQFSLKKFEAVYEQQTSSLENVFVNVD